MLLSYILVCTPGNDIVVAPGRIDCFSELSTNAFGEKLKEQVEERLRFYEEGVAPTKNSTAMQEALATARVSLSHHWNYSTAMQFTVSCF